MRPTTGCVRLMWRRDGADLRIVGRGRFADEVGDAGRVRGDVPEPVGQRAADEGRPDQRRGAGLRRVEAGHEAVAVAAVEGRIEGVGGREAGIGFADHVDLAVADVGDAHAHVDAGAAQIRGVDERRRARQGRVDHRDVGVVVVAAAERRLVGVHRRQVGAVGVAGQVGSPLIVDGQAAGNLEVVLAAAAAVEGRVDLGAGGVELGEERLVANRGAAVGVGRLRERDAVGRAAAADVDVAGAVHADAGHQLVAGAAQVGAVEEGAARPELHVERVAGVAVAAGDSSYRRLARRPGSRPSWCRRRRRRCRPRRPRCGRAGTSASCRRPCRRGRCSRPAPCRTG